MKNEIRPQPRKVHRGDSFRSLATVPLAFLPSPDLLEASLYQRVARRGMKRRAAPSSAEIRQSSRIWSIFGTPTAHQIEPTAAIAAVTTKAAS